MKKSILSALFALSMLVGIITGCDTNQPDNNGKTAETMPDYKDAFRILAIGNSFSRDAMSFMYDMAVANGADIQGIDITNAYIGGATLSLHATNAKNNIKAYTHQTFKSKGQIIEVENVTLKSMIERNYWDVITLQQASQDTGKPSTYNADIAYLIDYIREHATNPNVVIAWHMTWAYANYSSHQNFPDYGNNQMTMYNAIIDAVKTRIVPNNDFAFVIPAGTAIQNARTIFGETLNWADGYHLNLTGQFIAGAMMLRSITGWDIDIIDEYSPANLTRGAISKINQCVQDAFNYPYGVTIQE